jgi:hypothetical protein
MEHCKKKFDIFGIVSTLHGYRQNIYLQHAAKRDKERLKEVTIVIVLADRWGVSQI